MSFNLENNKKRTFNDVIEEHTEHISLFNVTLKEINYISYYDNDTYTEKDYILLDNHKKQKINNMKQQ